MCPPPQTTKDKNGDKMLTLFCSDGVETSEMISEVPPPTSSVYLKSKILFSGTVPEHNKSDFRDPPRIDFPKLAPHLSICDGVISIVKGYFILHMVAGELL